MKIEICETCGKIIETKKHICKTCGTNLCDNCYKICGDVCGVCGLKI